MDTPNGRTSVHSPSPSPSPSRAPPLPPSRPSSSTTPSPSPLREDCWTEDATFTLVEAWGQRYLTLNRGNLRQHHWQEVADAVTARHSRRTDIQCKNRIDTLKKKYKLEKARVLDSNGTYTSPWPFFASVDALIGSNFPAKTSSSSSPVAASENSEKENPKPRPQPRPALNFSSPVPVRPRSNKRTAREQFPSPLLVDDSNAWRRFPAVEKDKESSEKGSGERRSRVGRERSRNVEMEMELGLGFRELAEAVERLGDIYEKVEKRKQREIWELEKVRMEFTKDLEEGRMKFFGEMQLYLHKMNKKSRGLSMADAYSWMAM